MKLKGELVQCEVRTFTCQNIIKVQTDTHRRRQGQKGGDGNGQIMIKDLTMDTQRLGRQIQGWEWQKDNPVTSMELNIWTITPSQIWETRFSDFNQEKGQIVAHQTHQERQRLKDQGRDRVDALTKRTREGTMWDTWRWDRRRKRPWQGAQWFQRVKSVEGTAY